MFRYKFIHFPMTSQVAYTGSNCSKILRRAGLKEAEVGKTKVWNLILSNVKI